jgi:uncharacterized delta-60 repeat protein
VTVAIISGEQAMRLEPLESRRMMDGEYDNAFSFDGKVLTSFGQPGAAEALTVAVQPDGKAVVGGYATFNAPLNGSAYRRAVMARYNLDGTLDATFDGDGQWIGPGSNNGLFQQQAAAVAVQPDGKLLVLLGTTFNGEMDGGELRRLMPDGSPDVSFGNGGATPVLTDGSWAVLRTLDIDRHDRIVVAGTFESEGVVARFTPTGQPDPGFGAAGRTIISRGSAERLEIFDAHLTGDDKVLLAGGTESSHAAILMRLGVNGLPDNDFGIGGVVSRPSTWATRFTAVSLAADGVIWAGLELDDNQPPQGAWLMLVRIQGDGTALATPETGHSVGATHTALAPLTGGKFLSLVPMTDSPRLRRMRVDQLGFVSRDLTFSPTGSPQGTTYLSWTSGSPDYATAVAVAPNGRAYVAGSADATGLPQQFGVIAIVAAPNQAPAIDRSSFEFETAHRLRFQFNEPINPATLAAGDLTLTDLGTGQPVDATGATGAYDATTRTARFTLPTRLADGNYRAALAPGSVADPGGATNGESTGAFDFFVLAADANRDRRVNLQDFNILAANFGQTNRDFTQGDFNYDGRVNLQDFNILAGRFGQTVTPAVSGRSGDDEDVRDRLDELT